MARFHLQTIFVIACIVYAVSGAPKGKAKKDGNNKVSANAAPSGGSNNDPPGKNPCSGDVRVGDPCNITVTYGDPGDLVSWTGICAYVVDKGETPGHQLCMSACGEPDLDPEDNLVPGQTTTGPYPQGTSFVVECGEYYGPADGSSMEIFCVDGTWTDFAGECLAQCMTLDPTTVDPNAVDDSPHGNLEGDVAALDCGPGYVLMGTLTATCTDHSWVPDEENGACVSTCQPPDPAVVTLSDAELTIPDVTFTVDYVILFTCDPGYVGIGCNYAICLADGTWDVEGPGCTQTCDPIGTNPFGVNAVPVSTPVAPILEGTVIPYVCNEGWAETVPLAITCVEGEWTYPTETCVEDCGDVTEPSNTVVDTWTPAAGDTTLSAVITYVCSAGYWADPPPAPILTCTADGWVPSGNPCIPGCDPDDAPTDYFSSDGLTASLTCDDGTVLVVTCDQPTGAWDTPAPTCPADCVEPVLNPADNIEAGVNPGSAPYLSGTIFNVVCLNSYTPTAGSVMTITCTDGTWSEFTGVCLQECGDLDPTTIDPHAVINAQQGTQEGDRAFLGCGDGYVREGFIYADCIGGAWVPVEGNGFCKKACPTPDVSFDDAVITTPIVDVEFTEGDVVFFACNDGFAASACNYAVCEADGTWKKEGDGCTQTCDPVVGNEFGVNADPTHVPATPILEGYVLEFDCDPGWTETGSMKLTCTGGAWVPSGGPCAQECGDAPGYLEIPGADGGPVVTGNTATYTCFSETSLEETATATCVGTEWIIDDPGCKSVTQPCDDAIIVKLKPSVTNKCQQYLDHCYCPLSSDFTQPEALSACTDVMKNTETGLDTQLAVADTDEELLWLWTFGGYAIPGQDGWWLVYITDMYGGIVSALTGDPMPFPHDVSPDPPPDSGLQCSYFETGDETLYTDPWIFVNCEDTNGKRKSICEISLSTPPA